MKFLKIVALTIALLQCVSGRGISGGLSGFGGIGGGAGGLVGYGGGLGESGGLGGSYGGSFGGIGGESGSWGSGGINEPSPYSTNFQVPDGQGGLSFRTEQGDGSGNVRGSYGYRDAQGLYRMVEYSAGAAGFTATVKTNEPGVDGKENPADVIMNVEKTPAGIQERYTRPAGSGSRGRGGWSSGSLGGGLGGLGGGMTSGAYGGMGGISSGGYGGGIGGSSVGYGGIGGISSGGSGGMGGISGFSGFSRGGMGVRSGKSGY